MITTHDGKYSDNVRVNLTNNHVVDDYILLNETVTKLWQTGRRMSRLEIALLEPVAKVIEFLNDDKLEREKFILANNDSNSVCYCGQTKLYKNCHGYDVENGCNALLSELNGIIQKSTYE